MKRSLFIIAGVFAAASTLALAQATAPTGDGDSTQATRATAEARFGESDSDHDGKLSFSEWQSARNRQVAEQFRKLDANQDGSLTQEEMRQGHQQRRAGRRDEGGKGGDMRGKWQSLDTDGDKALSRAEIGDDMPRLAEHFDQFDGNHDGKISVDELKSGRDAVKK